MIKKVVKNTAVALAMAGSLSACAGTNLMGNGVRGSNPNNIAVVPAPNQPKCWDIINNNLSSLYTVSGAALGAGIGWAVAEWKNLDKAVSIIAGVVVGAGAGLGLFCYRSKGEQDAAATAVADVLNKGNIKEPQASVAQVAYGPNKGKLIRVDRSKQYYNGSDIYYDLVITDSTVTLNGQPTNIADGQVIRVNLSKQFGEPVYQLSNQVN